MPDVSPQSTRGGHGGLFPPTAWSAISIARRHDPDGAIAALRQLALAYWKPLYAFLRRKGESHEDAADSVQGFFAFVFSSGFFEHVDREGGKFRSYLLKSLERWRQREWRRESAQKRGGHVEHVPLEGLEEMEHAELPGGTEPEHAFDRQWAMEMVARAVRQVRAGYDARGRGDAFETLRGSLPGGAGLLSYEELAHTLGMAEGSVRKAVFDLRKAFATQLRAEIRATVMTPEEAEEELHYLISVVSAAA